MPARVHRSFTVDLGSSLCVLLATTLGCSVGARFDDRDDAAGLMGSTGGGATETDSDAVPAGSSDGEGNGGSSSGSDGDGGSSSGFEDDHAYQKDIRIPASGVSGTEDLVDFPVFVSLSDADLHDRAQEDGCDIAFFQGSTALDFELERFEVEHDAAQAKLAAWVRVPSLAATQDTVISLRYGLPCGSYEDPIGVWGADYELVWHMSSSADSQVSDSTINGFDGTLLGGPVIVDGKLGGSLVLDGVDDRVEGPLASELGVHGSAARTFSVWASVQNYDATTWGSIFGIGRMGGGCCLYNGFGINRGSNTLSFSVGGEWIQNANWSIFADGTGFDEWAYYAAVYDGDLGLRIHANGQLIEEVTLDAPLDTLDTSPLRLPYADDYIIGGPRDEMRISRRVRSDDWITTEFANQNDPESFYEVGPELAFPSSAHGREARELEHSVDLAPVEVHRQ
ncbi:MAG: hypothetical protein AB1Z98_25130 [Nannocystaceae bacterium]